MIDLDNDAIKAYFRAIIESEVDRLNVLTEEQKALNTRVFRYLNNLSADIPSNADDMLISDVSSRLVSVSELLTTISNNIKTLAELSEDLRKIKRSLSITDSKTIKKISQYNEAYSTHMEQISAATLKIETFIKESDSIYNRPIIPTPPVQVSIDEQIEKNLAEMSKYIEQIKQSTQVSSVVPVKTIEQNKEREELIAKAFRKKEDMVPEEIVPVTNKQQVTVNIEQPVGKRLKEPSEKKELEEIVGMSYVPLKLSDADIVIEDKVEEKILENKQINDSKKISESEPINDLETVSENKPIDGLDELTKDLHENMLIISETDKKVVLPYKIDDIIQIFKDNPEKYISLQQIIDKLYTRPLKDYKHSSNARFKEAYNLIRKKEKGSVYKALDLAFELFSNYNLHPAIITACKSLNELDVYLSCLEYNELSDFNFFDIKFDTPPAKVKMKKSEKILQEA